jgi:hypothetical protein
VIAARLLAWAPNGAVSSEARPVTARIDRDGTGYPEARRTAKPGRFCDAIVTR